MLIVLLISVLIRTLHGIPLSPSSEHLNDFPDLHVRNAQTHFGERGVNDVVVSCFATIFACTWSAVHPNILAPTDSAWTRFKRQVIIIIYAFLAPEAIILWALQQRLGARRTVDKYNTDLKNYLQGSKQKSDRGWFQAILHAIKGLYQNSPVPDKMPEGKGPQWTLTHGFFLQMGGGVMMCEDGQPTQILTGTGAKVEATIIWNIEHGILSPPKITEDITDGSKGDTISKTFIVLQTTWFIVQCITRWSQRLPFTELEIVTLGFAILNGITYGIWWNKPQNVGRPVFLESRKLCSSDGTRENPTTNASDSPSLTNAKSQLYYIPGKKTWLRHKLHEETKQHPYSPALLWRIPFRVVQAVLRPLPKMRADDTLANMRVGMFYSGDPKGYDTIYVAAAIGAIFGLVHLVPSWFLDFASSQDRWLWRVSAMIITIEPILMGFVVYFDSLDQDILLIISGIFMTIGLPLYPISRIILLILSLISLHSLPSAALRTIEWTTFIPQL